MAGILREREFLFAAGTRKPGTFADRAEGGMCMLEVLFAIGLIWLLWKLIVLAVKAAWGITKVLVFIIFLPLILIGLVIGGLVYIAIPILIVAGIVGLLFGK
jgi:hypothetical protein